MLYQLRWSRLPLTQRLTLLFTAVAAALVLGLGALFLLETERHFVELDQMALQEKRHLVEDILRNADSPDVARQRLDQALGYHRTLQVRVEDASGALVFQSGESSHPVGSAAHPSAGENGTREVRQTDFQTLSFTAPAPYSALPLRVLIAADTEHHTRFLNALRRSLTVYTLLALALCGVLAWLAARAGLAPLRDMKARAAKVSGQKLGERMPVQAVPVEMADLAQELNHMLDRLQEDFQRLTDFASDLAHELRTPISNLLTQTQVALASRRDAATYRDILASNAEEFERLARMVSDMLLLAKTERGLDLPRAERFSARQDALALLDFYEAVAEEKGIRLQVRGDGWIEGDRLMFRRALSNLLSNALRHTPQAGEITVGIDSLPGATAVAVENTGRDIDPALVPRLFDRFYRADPARAHADSEGSGLGLAITRAIAEAHGGSVAVASGAGRTRFTLVFPHRPGAA